jgi:hypothetical protein
VKDFYYLIKPGIPRKLQIYLRRQIVSWRHKKYERFWPIGPDTDKAPAGWHGWPEERKFAFILTHDVETAKGLERVLPLMEAERDLGFQSSFYFVPERYNVSDEVRESLNSNGFEIGVHGLLHDGKLFRSREIFDERSSRINQYLRNWQAVGFRSPAMHHNLDWIGDLDIEYDASTFDTDPFEPQSDGAGTIFPLNVTNSSGKKGYVELPYTLPQDHCLFIIMKANSMEIWKQKLDWIVDRGGMALMDTHPDYMNFGDKKVGTEEYPVENYLRFLNYVKYKYEGSYWHVLPREIARFWRKTVVASCVARL